MAHVIVLPIPQDAFDEMIGPNFSERCAQLLDWMEENTDRPKLKIVCRNGQRC